MNDALRLLCVGAPAPASPPIGFAGWQTQTCGSLGEATDALRQQAFDAVLIRLGGALGFDAVLHWQALSPAVLDAAVVVVVAAADLPLAGALVERGVQDVLAEPAADEAELARALPLAVRRKRLERQARKAYATDLATGLPNHAQLREHMTHLLALREREPAPMALLVLRVEGLASTAAALGPEAAQVLRRKAAVRLRAGLRASDVVASVGDDAFAVLLGWIDAPADAERVAAKLADALRQPFRIAGHDRVLAVGVGIAAYPQHGSAADELLRLALGQAAAAPASGREGFANRQERGPADAANDG
jgi:diguanylate cyclase (GGDEF)-like protein